MMLLVYTKFYQGHSILLTGNKRAICMVVHKASVVQTDHLQL